MDLLQLLVPLFLLQVCLLWASQVPNAIGRVALVESEMSVRVEIEMNSRIVFCFSIGKKMGWKWDIAVIPFPLRSSAWLCPFPTSCTLRGQKEKQERPWWCENTAQQYVKLVVSYQDCFGHKFNSQHHASFALCYWQIVTGPPPIRREFWEAWLLLCATSSCSDLQSG